MKPLLLSLSLLLFFFHATVAFAQQSKTQKPNIILIYVDDLGYGDVGCYGARRVKTPNVDALASKGVKFTDAHCSAATCTPSRFSLLTGSYAFRNNAAILPGDAPLLLNTAKQTLPAMLQKAGYHTGIVGKWHLGLGNGFIDWNKEIKPGPLELGFDHSFIVPATLDRVPCVFVDGHRVANLNPADPIQVDYTKKIGDYPTGIEDPELLKYKGDLQHSNTIINGISRIGYMAGGHSALWKDENMAMVLLRQVKAFIASAKAQPFFLYFSFTDIHVPRAPNKMFNGKSPMGIRGNDIAQMDWTVGQLMAYLQQQKLRNNTLIIFSSDNGPVLDDGYDDKAEELVGNHKPSGPFNGGKYSSFEGGTRVPTIVFWQGHTGKGTSNALLNQVDLFASLAALTGQAIEAGAAPDSENFLSAWLGLSPKGRQTMIEEGFTLSLRDGDWKYIAPQTGKSPDWLKNKNIATGLRQQPQLYNLSVDVHENKNVFEQNRERAERMKALLDTIVQSKKY